MREEKSKSGKVKVRNKALFIGIIGIVAIVLAVAAIGANANNNTEASDKVNVPDVPHRINYQGYLTDTDDNPITGDRDMTFRIYDSPTGGTPLWSETQTSVRVEKGLFNVILGSVNPIPGDVFPSGGSRWLETEIEGPPLTPRKEIVSVAYAFKANPDDDWCGPNDGPPTDPGDIFHEEGKVGIGLSSGTLLEAALDVCDVDFGSSERIVRIRGIHTASLPGSLYNTGIDVDIKHKPSSNAPGWFTAADFRAYIPNNCGVNIGTLGGVDAKARHAGSGTVDDVYGLNAYASNWGGPVTNAYGVKAYVLTPLAAGNIANGYGIYIDDNTGNIGNSYGLYQVGSDDTNYFAGNVGIGTTNPAFTLDIKGNERCYCSDQTNPNHENSYIQLEPNLCGYCNGVAITLNECGNRNKLWISAYDSKYGNLIYTEDPQAKNGQSFGIAGGSRMAPFLRFVVNANETFLGYSIYPGIGGPCGVDGTGNLYVRGNVGIGTTTPQGPLQVGEGSFIVTPENKVGIGTLVPKFNLDVTSPTGAYIRVNKPVPDHACGFILATGGKNKWHIFMPTADSEDLWFYDGQGALIPEMVIKRGTGNVGIGTPTPAAKLHVVGDILVTGTKDFVQAHPTDPTKEIVYVSLEGPEAGTYIRGTAQLVNGEAVINLPEHFSLVTSDEGLTVQLTPAGEWLQLYVVEKGTQRIIIHEANDKNGQFDYLVQGVRKGYENHQVIGDKE